MRLNFKFICNKKSLLYGTNKIANDSLYQIITSCIAANQLTLYVYYMDTHLYTYSQAAFLNSH